MSGQSVKSAQAAADAPVVVDGLGGRLRSLRHERGELSLAEVGAATGMSSSFLSLVENGRNDLTVARLVRLVDYYGVSVTDLLPDPGEQRPEIVRRANQRRIPSRSERMDLYLLVHEGDRAMMPVIATYEVGGGTREFLSYESDQFDYVLGGHARGELRGRGPDRARRGRRRVLLGPAAAQVQERRRGPARALHIRSPGN